MNERIEELAEQAGSTHKQSLGVYQFYEHELKEFAELIIQECVKEIHAADLGDLFGRDQYLDKVAEHIKNHFGVES